MNKTSHSMMESLYISLRYIALLSLMIALSFSSAVFTVLLYDRFSGGNWSQTTYRVTSQTAVSPDLSYNNPILDQDHVRTAIEQDSAMKKTEAMLDAPIIRQLPELWNGCEVTTLAMLLQYYGYDVDKMDLAKEMKLDTTPIVRDANGKIVYWGHPDSGFVGDVTGKQIGYSINASALLELLIHYIPSGIDLSGHSFDDLEKKMAKGIPVIAWTSVSFQEPSEEQWLTWDSPSGPVRATFQVHSVLLVGYDESHIYVNDPLSGNSQFQIDKNQFIASWEALGRQALSY